MLDRTTGDPETAKARQRRRGDDDDDEGEEGRLAASSQPWKMENIPFLGNITFLQETSVSVPVPVPVCLCTNIFV